MGSIPHTTNATNQSKIYFNDFLSNISTLYSTKTSLILESIDSWVGLVSGPIHKLHKCHRFNSHTFNMSNQIQIDLMSSCLAMIDKKWFWCLEALIAQLVRCWKHSVDYKCLEFNVLHFQFVRPNSDWL